MKYLTIIFLGIFISLSCYGQIKFSNLDSTNYKEVLLNTKDVEKKLSTRFVGLKCHELTEIIGSKYDTIYDRNSKLIRNKNEFKNNYFAVVYDLGMINYDQTSSNSFKLVAIVKKNKIEDIYIHSMHISWAK